MTKRIRESNGDLTGLALNATLYFIKIHESTSSNFHQEWEEFRKKKKKLEVAFETMGVYVTARGNFTVSAVFGNLGFLFPLGKARCFTLLFGPMN